MPLQRANSPMKNALESSRKQTRWFGRTVTTINILTIIAVSTGGAAYFSHPEWFAGYLNQAMTSKAVSGRKIITTAPSKEVTKQAGVTYDTYEGFNSFSELQGNASIQQRAILRGFVAMPATNVGQAIYSPIYEGTSMRILSIGAGVGRPNSVMGKDNFSIFAHNMGDYMTNHATRFSPLQQMDQSVVGSKVYTTNGSDIYQWRVKSLKNVSYTDVSIMDSDNKPRLTMVTCLEDAKWWSEFRSRDVAHAEKRIVLQSDLVNKTPFKDAPKDIKVLFPDIVNGNVSTVAYADNVTVSHRDANHFFHTTTWQTSVIEGVNTNGRIVAIAYVATLGTMNLANVILKYRRREN